MIAARQTEKLHSETITGGCKSSAPKSSREDGALSEAQLIELAQRNDASAFEHIYLKHQGRIYAVCLRIVSNPAEAEDLVQETFMQVLRKIRTFRGDSALSTWLHRIAVNLSLMRLRRKPNRETSLEETVEQLSDATFPREELAAADPQLATSLDRLHLQRALGQLRPSQKLVVELHDIQGYKHTEIAQMLDWTIGNSKSQLHRARTRLRKALQNGVAAAAPTKMPRPRRTPARPRYVPAAVLAQRAA
jgi:RNA polymerase sigma-70 factor, ECF subfamily